MKKLGLLVLVLVLAVASLGVGYAWWSHTIVINGTVSSANFAIDTSITSTDSGNNADPGNGIHVGSTDVTKTDTLNYTVTVANVYPGYNSQLTCTLTNTGSIPVKVKLNDFNWTSGSPALAAAIVAGSDYDTAYSEGAVIAAGETVTVTIYFAIDEEAGNEIIGQTVAGKISFNVQQFNQ